MSGSSVALSKHGRPVTGARPPAHGKISAGRYRPGSTADHSARSGWRPARNRYRTLSDASRATSAGVVVVLCTCMSITGGRDPLCADAGAEARARDRRQATTSTRSDREQATSVTCRSSRTVMTFGARAHDRLLHRFRALSTITKLLTIGKGRPGTHLVDVRPVQSSFDDVGSRRSLQGPGSTPVELVHE